MVKAFSGDSVMWRMIGLLRDLVYVGKCAGSRSVVRQARRMVQDSSEWRGFVREGAWGVPGVMNT